jgi:N-acyl-D-amino-acid deacylase
MTNDPSPFGRLNLISPFDFLIRNASIVDGSGDPSYQADVVVSHGRIVDIGHFPDAQAVQVIDAAGKVLCPGFIDSHSHSELEMLAGKHTAGIQMGVTTEFTSPDGFGFSRLPAGILVQYRRYLHGIYGDPDVSWDWQSTREYLGCFMGHIYNNVASQVAHGAVRLAVKGWTPGPASPAELDAMCRMVREDMEEGAVGMAAGLDYAPASHSDTQELVALSKIVAGYGGVYATHMRGYDEDVREAAVAETVAIAEQAGIAVHVNHFFGNPSNFASVEAALLRGIDITLDSYPYPAGATLLTFVFSHTAISSDLDEFSNQIQTPEIRQLVKQVLEKKLAEGNPAYFAYLTKPHNQWMEGKRVREAWRESSAKPFDQFVCDLLLDEGVSPLLIYPWSFNPEVNEERLRFSLTHPLQMVITDGIYVGGSAHPRGWGTYPRILGQYVREKRWLSLEDAVRRMTAFPAARFGLADRGMIKKGLAADMVIFDSSTVIDRATWNQPHIPPIGIEDVFVNGIQVVADGQVIPGEYAGQLLRRNR